MPCQNGTVTWLLRLRIPSLVPDVLAGFIAAALFSDDTERRIDEYPAKEDDADSDTDGE